MWSFVEFAKAVWRRYLTSESPFAAAAIAYYGFLSLVPFLLLLVSGVGAVSSVLTSFKVVDVDRVLAFLLERYGSDLARFAGTVLARSAGYGLAGLVGMFLAASVVVTPVDWALVRIFGGEGMRSFVFQRLVSLAVFLVAISGGYVLVGAGTLFQAFVISARRFLPRGAVPLLDTVTLVSTALSFVLAGLFAAISYLLMAILPRRRPARRHLALGALFSGVAIELARQLFLLYVRLFPVYDLVYGAIGFLFALVALLYLVSALFLAGACLTRELEDAAGR